MYVYLHTQYYMHDMEIKFDAVEVFWKTKI